MQHHIRHTEPRCLTSQSMEGTLDISLSPFVRIELALTQSRARNLLVWQSRPALWYCRLPPINLKLIT